MAKLTQAKSIGGLSLDQLRRRRWFQARKPVLIGGVVTLLLVIVTVWLLFFSSVFGFEKVVVNGADPGVTKAIHRSVAGDGSPLISLDVSAIQSRIATIPAVLSVTVERSWPQSITITVVERTPVAVVAASGGYRNIDVGGVVFGARSEPGNLPLIRLSGKVDLTARKGAAVVAGSLPASILHQVQSITVRTMDDIVLNLSGSRRVMWGSSEDSATKAEVATLLLKNHNRIIDVSVPSNPTAG